MGVADRREDWPSSRTVESQFGRAAVEVSEPELGAVLPRVPSALRSASNTADGTHMRSELPAADMLAAVAEQVERE
ncbi:MAG: hypothetical protein ACRDL5_16645 [Solirubrobacteraceae bacterium]